MNAETIIRGLIKAGCAEIPTRSKKFRQFTRNMSPNPERLPYWFVGKSGSLRTGRTLADSIPTSEANRTRIEALGRD